MTQKCHFSIELLCEHIEYQDISNLYIKQKFINWEDVLPGAKTSLPSTTDIFNSDFGTEVQSHVPLRSCGGLFNFMVLGPFSPSKPENLKGLFRELDMFIRELVYHQQR
jgi:hypothetical protein